MPARRRAVLPETRRRSVLKGGSHKQLTPGVPPNSSWRSPSDMPARRRVVLPETGRRSVLKGGSHEQLTARAPNLIMEESVRFASKKAGSATRNR
jgi:hypothetical protein